VLVGDSRRLPGRLLLATQAPGAEVEPLYLAVDSDGDRVDIRQPTAVGTALGVTHVMTELGRFAA